MLAVPKAVALGVERIDERRAAILALDEGVQVVHPRVVRAELAAADQDHLRARAVPGSLVEALAKPRHVSHDRLGRQLDLP